MKIKKVNLTSCFIISAITLFLGGCKDTENAFTEICNIVDEGISSGGDRDTISEYMHNEIEERINNADAIAAWQMIFHLDPSERYQAFKQAAEISLGEKWSCEVMANTFDN